jgi:hypothetical protein
MLPYKLWAPQFFFFSLSFPLFPPVSLPALPTSLDAGEGPGHATGAGTARDRGSRGR